MRRKIFITILVIVFAVLSFSQASFAANKKAASAPAVQKAAAPAMPAAPKPNFGMLAGTVSSVDDKDASSIKLVIKSDTDGSLHTVFVTPGTNITKVTDVSELKTGEPVRMMTRKIDDKDMAMGIMFGKVKIMTPPAPKTVPAPSAAKTAAKAKK